MTTIREAYHAFSDYGDRQRKTIQSIKDEIREGRAQIADTKKELQNRIAYLFSDYETFPDEILTEASQAAGSERNFTLLLAGMERENDRLTLARARLVNEHGSPERLVAERTKLNAAILETVTQTHKDNDKLRVLSDGLEPFNQHLRKIKYALSGELEDDQMRDSVAHYTTPSFKNYFSPDWLIGNHLVKKYEANGANLVNDWATRTQLRFVVGRGMVDSSIKEQRVTAITAATEEMESLKKQIKPEAKIFAVLQDRLFEAMFDEKFIDEITERLGKEITEPLAESVLKIVNLTKIENNLEGVLKTAEKTLDKLDAPMSKLRRGSSNAGYKSISIDLPPIEAAVAGQERFVRNYTNNTQQARSAIRDYSYTTPSTRSSTSYDTTDYGTLNLMNMWMIMSIMDSPQTNSDFIGQTLGDFNTPDISVPDTSSLQDVGNLNLDNSPLNDIANQSFGVPDFSTPDINVSVPDINISVPDFSIPDTSYSSSDFSSSYSDSGGGSFSSD